MARTAVLGVLLGVLSGCTVSAIKQSDDQGPSNSCASSSDCSNGHCERGICQTLNGHLESLLLEVTPTAESSLPHIPFITHLEDVPTSGGQRDIALVRSARVSGHLKPNDKPGCMRSFYGPEGNVLSPSTDGLSLPITVALRPRDSLLGLPTQVYLADARLPRIVNRGAVEYTFELQVPAATYDVYVVPVGHNVDSTDPATVETCRVPPQLFRRQLISNDTVLDYTASATTSLALEVMFPQSAGDLEGWLVDIIEPLNGNPISTERVLPEPAVVPGQFVYTVQLAYSDVTEFGQAEVVVEGANDLIRLRPPLGLVAPTVFLDRAGLGLFSGEGQPTAKVSSFTKFPTPVMVEGQMATLDTGAPTSGRVDLVSTEIFGVDNGIFAAFQTSAMVDERGFFSVSLPPGKYRVFGVPSLSGDALQQSLSAHEVMWDVPADPPFQAGRLLELPPRAEVNGRTSLPSAEIQAVASPQTILPFEQAFGAAAFIPRAKAGLVDSAGRFVVQADPGLFDITVRPPEASGYPWSVRAGFLVEPGSPQQELGRLDLSRPSLMEGTVSVGDGPAVPFALMRAYAYLDENLAYTGDPKVARSVVQVAQTRTDENGEFRLLVPESLKE